MYFILIGLIAALFLNPTIARACHDDNDARTMTYDSIAVRVEITGIRHYDSAGSCSTGGRTKAHPDLYRFSFTASGSWDPATNQANEIVNGSPGWKVETIWSCPSDPWLTRSPLQSIPCTRRSRSSTENAPALISDDPFSSSQAPVNQLLQQYKKAMPARPAFPPRDVKASTFQDQAHISWGIPVDQTSMHRTVAWFRVERRPAGQPQVSWFPASNNLPATLTGYADPDRLVTPTEYRVCALNVSGGFCSEGVVASPSTMRLQATTTEFRAEQLTQRVQDALQKQFPQIYWRIKIAATGDGVVTLTGNVPTPLDKLRLGEATAKIQGVTGVDNQLDSTALISPVTRQPIPGVQQKPAKKP